MNIRHTIRLSLLLLLLLVRPGVSEEKPPAYSLEKIRGKVVWQADALQRRYGVGTLPEARKRVLALETPKGEIHPLVEDLRGRSFRKDPRLMEMQLELLVRRYQKAAPLQVIRIYEIRPQKNGQEERLLIDYWCDICSIIMFEYGPCDCCQDHNRLRKRAVER